jgi:hypothetical protein
MIEQASLVKLGAQIEADPPAQQEYPAEGRSPTNKVPTIFGFLLFK